MTREQLQQVREGLIFSYKKLAHPVECFTVRPTEDWVKYGSQKLECKCDIGGIVVPALAIIDAELAKPEAREWRVSHEYKFAGIWSPVSTSLASWTKAEAESFAHSVREAQNETVPLRNVVIESRTPAGPWEPTEEPCK